MADTLPGMAVPLETSGLDVHWFNRALALCGEAAEVTRVDIVKVIEGTCTKIRVALEYAADRGLPPTMLVKGGFAVHSHLFLGMHETEARYYWDIAPSAPFDTPACHAAILDPANGRSVVVLEDLDRRAIGWLGALRPLGWHAEVAFVDALALLAARYWNSEELAVGGRLDWVIHSYEREAADYIDHYLEPETWARFIALPRGACLPKSLHDRDRMCAALATLARRLDTQPITLSHGDAHLGNLYLTGDGRPGFLDAQPRRAPWVKDFAYHLVAALDIEDRRAWEKPLLARYLRKLFEAGVDAVPSFEEAWYDYRCEIAYGLFIFLINEGHFQREEVNTAYTARFGNAAIDHGTLDLLR